MHLGHDQAAGCDLPRGAVGEQLRLHARDPDPDLVGDAGGREAHALREVHARQQAAEARVARPRVGLVGGEGVGRQLGRERADDRVVHRGRARDHLRADQPGLPCELDPGHREAAPVVELRGRGGVAWHCTDEARREALRRRRLDLRRVRGVPRGGPRVDPGAQRRPVGVRERALAREVLARGVGVPRRHRAVLDRREHRRRGRPGQRVVVEGERGVAAVRVARAALAQHQRLNLGVPDRRVIGHRLVGAVRLGRTRGQQHRDEHKTS